MKNKWLIMTAAVAAIVGLSASVQATPIDGSIGFGGTFTQTGGTAGQLNTATSFNITSFSIGTTTGDFVGAGAPDSFATPIGVNGNAPTLVGSELWSVTVSGVTYDLLVTTENQGYASSIQLNLSGNGTLQDGTSGDDTAGTWQIGFGKTGASFLWQSTSANNVPDGGTTVMLLGAALAGIGLLRKKLLA